MSVLDNHLSVHIRRAISHSHMAYAETAPSWLLLNLTLNRLGFLQIGMAGAGADSAPLRNFCLNGPIDLKFGM